METFFDAAACEKSNDRILSLRVTESSHSYTVRLLAPGLSQKDISITVSGRKVVISNKASEKSQPLAGPYYSFSGFVRTFTTVMPVDAQNIKMVYRNNFIEVTLRKKGRNLPRRMSGSHPVASSI